MGPMTPLLIVALIIWAGVFLFMWSVDRRVRAVELRLKQRAAEQSPLSEKEPVTR
jgi:CcmD family protein